MAEIKVSQSHACAVLESREVKCWGEGVDGALANHSTGGINNVVGLMPLSLGRKVQQISLGYRYSCALLDTGSVRCWGGNNYGQLGLGHTTVIGDNEFPVERITSTFKDPGDVIIARFDYEANSTNPLILNFNGGLSFAKGSIAGYAWNFGDKMTGTGVSPSHTFSGNGSYTVSLTVTDNFGATHQASKDIVVEGANSSPVLEGGQSFTITKNTRSGLNLKAAIDSDSESFTYSMVSSPSQGTLSACLGGTNDLLCTYQPPMNFTGEVEFSYKANDGTSDSNTVVVKINVIDPVPSVVQISSFLGHSCALFDNKKIKCWGRNNYGQLGYGHTNNIGDGELISAQGFVDVGGNVLQVAVGGGHTCALFRRSKNKVLGA